MTGNDSTAAAPAHAVRFLAQDVCVSRGGTRIVNDISLTLQPGDAAILRGPNGSGKTTLLRAFAGLLRIDCGTLRTEKPGGGADDLYGATIYCGPLNAVKAALTVDENLRFWAALYRAPSEDIARARAAFLLDRYAARSARTLSTGLSRRLGLSRLLLSHKPIWFIDEPTAALDAASIDIFRSLIEEHRASGGIAVIATHDAFTLCGARHIELAAGFAA